jgi:SAM-dependent methyltransferase
MVRPLCPVDRFKEGAPRFPERRGALMPHPRILFFKPPEVGLHDGVLLVQLRHEVFEARRRAAAFGARFEVRADLPDALFDLVLAFEVLEHIEDEQAALQRFGARIRPGGHLLLSVPAHHRRWGPHDVWAGHVRRYEREELAARLREAGLAVEFVWSYGFPLANWVEPLRERVAARRNPSETQMSAAERTARSGVERSRLERLAGRLVEGPLIAPFCWLQLAFLERDWGNGYLALARRSA